MSIGRQQQKKRSRRVLVEQAGLTQVLLRTLAAILIDRDGPLVVTRESMMLASGLRVDASSTAAGHTLLTLQDRDGKPLPMPGAPASGVLQQEAPA